MFKTTRFIEDVGRVYRVLVNIAPLSAVSGDTHNVVVRAHS